MPKKKNLPGAYVWSVWNTKKKQWEGQHEYTNKKDCKFAIRWRLRK